ncbi:MAG: sigma-70 family RNA polymerase sigma factor [Candidatus Obscuribacterales bacterium]|nr:sigma-70 family RNA polymerase sigma factor [Candidatus Obscuribacterales bacterium]
MALATVSDRHDLTNTMSTEELVKQYLPLVRQIAKRYGRMMPESTEDLTQIGCLGLLKAIKYYDNDRQHKASFRTFATVYIKGEIRHYLRDHGTLVQVPRRLNEINSKIVQLEEVLTRELDHSPSIEEIAVRSGFTTTEVREAREARDTCHHYESLESSDDDDGREDTRVLSELVADKKYIDELSYSEDREVISQALVSLGERTKKIVEFVYFYDLTQKETAKILGLSEMGVSRAVRGALQKLKEIMLTEIF